MIAERNQVLVRAERLDKDVMTGHIASRKIQSLERALDVLQALQRGPRRVSELATDTGSSKATVHHILATLEGRRIVAREPGSFRYRLGWGAYELGASVTHESGFDIFVPQLNQPARHRPRGNDALLDRRGR